MRILVSGAAGFIGFHAINRLSLHGHELVGIDNLNNYYDVNLKNARLLHLKELKNFSFIKADLGDRSQMENVFQMQKYDKVLHLGAQAGVRYSLENPYAYLNSNLAGTLNILEGCRQQGIDHLIYASSSSVYGSNKKLPFSIEDRVDSPVSLYAATKKSNELMCHTYSHLFGLKSTGLRFFTVYGPWGRPDMAYFKFANAIKSGSAIDVYNNGDMQRDFTYIDDIIDGIEAIVDIGPVGTSDVPHKIYNLGNNNPEQLLDMIKIMEQLLGKSAEMRMLPMQPGDVYSTYADISDSARDYGFSPKTDLTDGLKKFVDWYEEYSAGKFIVA